jgi:N-acetylmuramoyl-L-alanine amidase
MATIPTKPDREETTPFMGARASAWPRGEGTASEIRGPHSSSSSSDGSTPGGPSQEPVKPSQRDALQVLLAFSALHEQVRRRRVLAAKRASFDTGAHAPQQQESEFEKDERFILDEVLQLVAERGVAITGADGLAIALAENDEIVLRAAAGTVRPDVGARIDRDSAFSGASFRLAQVVNCDDTETDARVNLQACRRLGARSMVAVPLCGKRRVIGLLEAFSAWPFGFNDSDVRNLTLLAELIVGALRPEDEDRYAQAAEAAANKLEPAPDPGAASVSPAPPAITATPPIEPVVTAMPTAMPAAMPAAKPSALPAKPSTTTPVPIVSTPPIPAVAHPAVDASSAAVPAAATPPEAGPAQDEASSAASAETTEKTETTDAEDQQWLFDQMRDPARVPLAETTDVPDLRFGQLEPERSTRPGVVIVLVCIVVAAAFGAGVLWKLKSSQMGRAMVTQQPSETPPPATSNASTPTAPPAAVAATPEAPDASELPNTPATQQELTNFPRVTGIRHWTSADTSTVVLDLEDQVQYEAHRLASPERIYFDLRDTQLTPEAAKSVDVTGDTLLNRVRVAQPVAGMTRVVLETKADSNFSVSLEPNPYRLVIEVRKVGVTPKGAVNLFPNAEAEKSRLAIVIPPPTKQDLQLKAHVPKMRIVVDAGHGGWDLGTVGRRGLLEKDLVLEIAQRLGKLLENRLGADVIYTRQDDNYIPLDDRAEIANQSQADLFVSVHANYSDLPSARGVETYYTNTFSAPGSKEAGSKTAVLQTTNGGKILTLSPTDLREKVEQSRRLAASVQRSLYGTLVMQNPGLRDRGIKEAGFVVLTESAMPGILAEVSFVSSPTDEQKLRSDGYREQIAEALYRGIARYAATSKGLKLASTGK